MNYKKLFNYMSEEHGVTLLEQDMQEICNIVNEMQSNELRQPLVIGSVCDGCGSKFDAMDISVGVCYCCQKEIKQTDL